MDHNPYSPPQANTEASSPPETVAVARPFAVWLLIALLLVIALMFVTFAVRYVGEVTAHRGEIRNVFILVATLVWRLTLVITFFAAAFSAYRRHPWSRWFGVALIAALAAVLAFRTDTTHYANDAERAGGQLGRLLVPLLLAWWIYVLAFSSKAKQYFSKLPSGAA